MSVDQPSIAAASPPFAREPLEELELGACRITLLGTAHVSRSSAETVRELLAGGDYDAVAVELCPSRYNALVDPDSLSRLDLLQVMREGKAATVMANLALGAYQQRLADRFGIEPGGEQRAAVRYALQNHRPVMLIDREIGVTLKRVAHNLGWWKKLDLLAGLLTGLLSQEQVSEAEIERLKEGDLLETTFSEFARNRRDLYLPLIDERDRYMAARLASETGRHGYRRVLAVVGAGHLRGIRRHLEAIADDPRLEEAGKGEIAELERLPPRSGWGAAIPWVIVAAVCAGFAAGFSQAPELGWEMVLDWVLINGLLAALGTILAAGHPLTVLTAFLAAPLTSLNPAVGVGMAAAAVEIWVRKPAVGDFQSLRRATRSLAGWWGNRVSRALLVFLLSSIGSALGTWIAGARILGRLAA